MKDPVKHSASRPGPGKAKAWKTVRKIAQSTIENFIGFILTFKSQNHTLNLIKSESFLHLL